MELFLESRLSHIMYNQWDVGSLYWCECHGKELVKNPTAENICQNPFFRMAEEAGDVELQIRMKMYHRVDTPEDCRISEGITSHIFRKIFGII